MQAQAHIAACEAAGATVMHGVDAGKLQGRFADASFKRIIFNFPHTGQQRVHVNRAMVAAFFASARCAPSGHCCLVHAAVPAAAACTLARTPARPVHATPASWPL